MSQSAASALSFSISWNYISSRPRRTARGMDQLEPIVPRHALDEIRRRATLLRSLDLAVAVWSSEHHKCLLAEILPESKSLRHPSRSSAERTSHARPDPSRACAAPHTAAPSVPPKGSQEPRRDPADDPPRRMPLFARFLPVTLQDRVDQRRRHLHRQTFFLLRCAGTAFRSASPTIRRCTPGFRATPITEPTPISSPPAYLSILALQPNSTLHLRFTEKTG